MKYRKKDTVEGPGNPLPQCGNIRYISNLCFKCAILCENFFQENVEFFEKGDYFLKEGETGGVIKLAKKKISHSRRLGTSACTGNCERERATFERHTREEY